MKEQKNRVVEFLSKGMQDYPGYKVIYLCFTGSVLHGTSTENSDIDAKGLFVPSLDDIIAGDYPRIIQLKTNEEETKNSNEDIDIELVSISEYLELLNRSESNMLEILFSMGTEFEIFSTEQSSIILNKRKELVINKVLSFTGFAMKQAAKYSVKGDRVRELEETIQLFKSFADNLTAKEMKKVKLKEFKEEIARFVKDKKYVFEETRNEAKYISVLNRLHSYHNTIGHSIKLLEGTLKNYGVRAHESKNANGTDYKALAHAIRAIDEARELLTTGEIKFPLSSKEHLLDIKTGKISVEDISTEMEAGYSELMYLSDISEMKKSIDKTFLKDILVSVTRMTYGL